MRWQKAPQELKDLLDSAIRQVECEKRVMFGYPAYFINRNMFAGLFQDRVFLRLPAESMPRPTGKAMSPEYLEPMKGRPMKGYVLVPPQILTDIDAFSRLVGEAGRHAASLPRKEAKKKAGKKGDLDEK